MTDKINVQISKGFDEDGPFMEHSTQMPSMPEMASNITRQYYKIVDEAVIKNMPDDILEDLLSKLKEEYKTRNSMKI